jgi:multiple sugar transport system ATP-binding protein
MATVSIRNVRKRFGTFEVLHGVSVEIEDGEFVILVGPSGCGKSTLLRMIAGLENISDGEIAIGGRVVNNVAPKERDIAMVFQNYALYPHMTVRDNMAFALSLARAPKAVVDEKVARAAQILGLAPYLNRYPRHRARSAGVPVRRTAVQPGCQAACADARRDQGTAPAPGHHHGLCHA